MPATCSYNTVTDDKRQATTETRILFVLSKFQGYRIDLILAQETNERSPILGAESVYDLHKPFKMNWNQTNNKRMRNANYQFQVSKWERLTLHKHTRTHNTYLCNILLWVGQRRPNILVYRCASILCRCLCEFFYILAWAVLLHLTNHDESEEFFKK